MLHLTDGGENHLMGVGSNNAFIDLNVLKLFFKLIPVDSLNLNFRMDTKGNSAEISYPNIFFILDNFEEVSALCTF